jgi:hypothetical protein
MATILTTVLVSKGKKASSVEDYEGQDSSLSNQSTSDVLSNHTDQPVNETVISQPPTNQSITGGSSNIPPPVVITFPPNNASDTSSSISFTATTPPAMSPTIAPVLTPTTDSPRCFTTRDQLKEAVDEYMKDHSKHSPIAERYGWPIGEWCTSLVTDFSGIFHNGDLSTGLINHEDPLSIKFAHFDESLANWDVSNAVNMASMFRGAKHFTGQGLNRWYVNDEIAH